MSNRDSKFNAAAQTLYEDVRAEFTVYKLDRSGGVDTSNPIATYNQLLLQSSQEQDSERTQVILSSDAPKMYSFGRQHRFFTYQGVILDTNLERDITTRDASVPSIWTGNSYAEWQDFFNRYASLSVCAKNRYLVQLTFGSKRLFGAMNQMTASSDATQPHRYDVIFSLYTTAVENIDVG